MQINIWQTIISLLGINISIWVSAKGLQVSKKDSERHSKISILIFSKDIKNTNMHFTVLVSNIVIVLTEIISACMDYCKGQAVFLTALGGIGMMAAENWRKILVWSMIVGCFIFISMIFVYRAVLMEPIKSDINGNRRLSASGINKMYLDFTRKDCIDSHSKLLLIAGDLSFLGDIPDVNKIKKQVWKNYCTKTLRNNETSHSCCGRKKCPSAIKVQCMEKSEQFAQLLDLRSAGITLHIICKQPHANNDVVYKRRLGRLVEMFSGNLEIHFLPEETLGHAVCVLGRIKTNGGMEELIWHWKNPNHPKTYTVPDTKKADTSENKTLIYLLGTVLWEYAQKADAQMLNEYIGEYKKILENT